MNEFIRSFENHTDIDELTINLTGLASTTSIKIDNININKAIILTGNLHRIRNFTISNSKIAKVDFACESDSFFSFEKSLVTQLKIDASKSSLSVRDSCVGRLFLDKKETIRNISLVGKTSINQFPCINTESGLVFKSFNIEKTVLIGTTTKEHRSEDMVQDVRNLRGQVQKTSNYFSTGIIHALELDWERSKEGFFLKAFNIFYKHTCRYGNNVEMPIYYLLLLMLFFSVNYYGYGVVEFQDEIYKSTGISQFDTLLNCLIYSFQVTFKPFSIFPIKDPIVNSYLGFFIALVQVIFSIPLISVLIISIRKRFKISQ